MTILDEIVSHKREEIAAARARIADTELERRLKGLGYRIVTIWPELMAEGIRDLAHRLDRPDLVSKL